MCRTCHGECGLHDVSGCQRRIFLADGRLRPAPAGSRAGLAARLPSGGLDAGADAAVRPICSSTWSRALRSGKEWQLGYWKHPPLPWWLTDLAYRVTGHIDAVYVLGPLAAVVCLYAVWLLARDTVGAFKGLIAVVALEGIHFYNILGREIRPRPDAAAVLGVYRTVLLARHRARTNVRLDAGRRLSRRRVLVEIRRVRARRDARPDPAVRSVRAARLAHAGPVCDGRRVRDRDRAECLVAGQQRLHAVPLCRRPRRDRDALVSLSSSSRCAGSAARRCFSLPAIALLALLYVPRSPDKPAAPADDSAFNRRYVAALALGPFAVTTVIAAVLGRSASGAVGLSACGPSLPLAVLMLLPPVARSGAFAAFRRRRARGADRVSGRVCGRRARRTVDARPAEGDAVSRPPPCRNHHPALAGKDRHPPRLCRRRHRSSIAATASCARLPGRREFAANNVAVYSPDRPHVIVNGELKLSPWIDAADLERRGVVLRGSRQIPGLAREPASARSRAPNCRRRLVLPRQTLFPEPPSVRKSSTTRSSCQTLARCRHRRRTCRQ